MPVYLNLPDGEVRSRGCITVGLINNMSDEALKTTERQYTSLLGSASGGMQVHLSFYTLPEVPRNDASARHIAAHYSSIDDLWEGELDGLIVTGREPLAAKLTDETYWQSFTKILLWAQENAHSTVWSCLAAHAAVLHMDGIDRVKRDDKLFGIFECARTSDHALTAGTPLRVKVPHSRWNGLPEDRLTGEGYRVLTRTGDAEVDTFIKQQKKLFVFFQGHPEYEADTLLREYRRDIGRYFKGERSQYPSMPQGYFDRDTMVALDTLQQRSESGQDNELLPAISAALSNITIEHIWRSSATTIYENWMRYIRAQKNIAVRSKRSQSIVNAPMVRRASAAL
ncbi:MAG: homoserine O-succinyltransferase [Acidobacteriaceae bacterium]|jgi:homoserine O-succinyltransferase